MNMNNEYGLDEMFDCHSLNNLQRLFCVNAVLKGIPKWNQEDFCSFVEFMAKSETIISGEVRPLTMICKI